MITSYTARPKAFILAQTLSADTRRRIQRYIANLASDDRPTVHIAESHLLRFGKRAIGQLIEALSSANPQVRLYAVYLLGKSGDPQVLPVIERFIGDPDGEVRYDAVMALGYLGDPRAIPILQAITSQEEDPACVASAAWIALGMFGIERESEPD